MTTTNKVARRKLSRLEPAHEMGNASLAYKIMGCSRQQFYEIHRNFQTHAAEGLIDRLPVARGPNPNRADPEVERTILDYNLTQPIKGCLAVA